MFCKQVKRHKEFRLGVLTADTESSVNQLQQTRSFRKHWVSFIQPLRQIKLQGQRDAVTELGSQIQLVHYINLAARVLSHLCKQQKYNISTAEV